MSDLSLVHESVESLTRWTNAYPAYAPFVHAAVVPVGVLRDAIEALRWVGDELVQTREDLGDTMLALTAAEEEVNDFRARCFDAEEELEEMYARDSRNAVNDYYAGV